MIQNILAQRYATEPIKNIFDEFHRNLFERELWLAVMKAQRELGVQIPSEDIEKFERSKEDIDLNAIREIEERTRHDIKAKIEHYVNVSGAGQHIHKGMTSRDLSDNVEQMQIRKASEIIFDKYVSVLRHMIEKSGAYDSLLVTGRTHHQPAQPTTIGKRFSTWSEELLIHIDDFERFILEYPLRGIKGPVGTQSDMLSLLGSKEKVRILEDKVANELGFEQTLHAVGQVYPRSLDYSLISKLSLMSSSPQNFALAMRLMSGQELTTEGFKEGQVGSSAMPHKMNTRSSERIYGFSELLKMYADGASRLSGGQWEEGDVSCSVVRRVIIPDAIFTSDGLVETTLTVLNEMGVYPGVIESELNRYLPFLGTTQILLKAIENGIGREEAHEVIKRHAVQAALDMREGKPNDLIARLSKDPLFVEKGIEENDLYLLLDNDNTYPGTVENQIENVALKAEKVISRHRKAAEYEPGSIL